LNEDFISFGSDGKAEGVLDRPEIESLEFFKERFCGEERKVNEGGVV